MKQKYSLADGVSKKKNTHGVSETFTPKTKLDIHFEELNRSGYTILKNIFSKKNCATAKIKIDQIYKKQIKECGNEKFLYSINDQDVVRALFVYDDFFIRFINNKNIINFLNLCFGNKFILNLQNSPINRPKQSHYGSTWHRDLSYQHFVPSRPIAITILICLDPFTDENGGTHILPFSHKFEEFASKDYSVKNEKILCANIGDVLIFDSLLFHRAGPNKSDEERKLLVQMYTLPFVKQQINYPKMLKGKYSKKKGLSYLLGYDSEIEDSVLNWRKRRKNRYSKAVK